MNFKAFLADQDYSEGPESTVTHDGVLYALDKIFLLSRFLPLFKLQLSEIEWMFDGSWTPADSARELEVDFSFPILVTPWQGKIVIIDGFHRAKKALDAGLQTILARTLYEDTLAFARVKD